MADVVYTDREYGGSLIRWGPIIAGVLVAMITQVLLGLLGLAIGLTAIDPGPGGLQGLGTGTGVWMILSSLVSVFIGAWVASWFANTHLIANAVLHGILTWSIFILLTLFLVGMGLGNLLGGAMSTVADAMGTGSTAGAPVSDIVAMTGPAGERLANLDTSEAVKQQIMQQVAMGNEQQAQQLITQNTDMSQAEAQQLVQDLQLEPRQVAQVTEPASRFAWWAFFAFLLSLAAAALGGWLGPKTTYTEHRVR